MINSEDLYEIEQFFKTAKLPAAPIKLDKCSRITDVPLFISSHLSIIIAQSGNMRYKPYLDRLIFLKSCITKNLK
jgi:hypothetical protein